ncbi:MAG: hypothetical protein GXP33_07715 [Spirochaetes bacterium]|nr:hypothetical protein [Spirochaetota bacterium]
MKIFVFGNINAGKTYYSNILHELYPAYKILRIDDFRIKYGKGDIDSDIAAQDKFAEAADATSEGIIECTGLGPLGQKLAKSCTNKRDIIIHIKASPEICLDRVKNKNFSKIPYPPFEETIENTIIRCHRQLKNGALEKLWKGKIIEIIEAEGISASKEEIKKIPINLYSDLDQILRFAHDSDKIDALISSGSFARGELTEFSDIDLFAITDLSTKKLQQQLKENIESIKFIDRIGNKITLRFPDQILAEINCIRHFDEIKVFYRESFTKDVGKTLLKGDKSYIKKLESAGKYCKNHFHRLAENLLSELFYFILSLNQLTEKRDRYKFYFHNNIILHNIIRLKAMDKGNYEFNYLPIDSEKYLSENEKKILFFNIKDDMKNHTLNIIHYFNDFLDKLTIINRNNKKMYIDYLIKIYPDVISS